MSRDCCINKNCVSRNCCNRKLHVTQLLQLQNCVSHNFCSHKILCHATSFVTQLLSKYNSYSLQLLCCNHKFKLSKPFKFFKIFHFRATIILKSDKEIINFYKDNIRNASAKLAFFMQDTFFDILHSETDGIQGIYLKQKLFSYPIGIGTFKNNFMSQLIEETLQRMIPAGVPQYLFEHHRWLKFGRIHVETEIGPNVLSMDDLSFGFVLWAAVCGMSVVVFVAECCGPGFKIFIDRLIGAFVIVAIFGRNSLNKH